MTPPDPETPPDPDTPPEPANLRFLRTLVTVLTGTMIAGIVVIVALIWARYSNARAPLPEVITLPSGVTATTFTQGPDWYAVVTDEDEVLIFDRATGALRRRLSIEEADP